MKLIDFHYELPPEAIAQEPVSPRDSSKLMVLDRASKAITHHRFRNIGEYLRPGDVLVTNVTKVFPARLRGKKITGGKAELLLLAPRGEQWKALVRGATQKTTLEFPEGLRASMTERLSEGEWIISFSSNHIHEYLLRHGEMPLPPYIKRPSPRASDLERYQTVFASQVGAIAAPTAGFHFTPELLAALQAKGIEQRSIVLHVGWGTFRPVRSETIEEHRMLAEFYEVSGETAAALSAAKQQGRRIVAIGTTVTRTLETVVDASGTYRAGEGETDLYIYPGYAFKGIDALLTNFHLPDSTPLLLASAFYGRTSGFTLKPAYEEAIREGYRFYSYGDAMFMS